MPLLEIENLSVDFTTRKGIARAVDGVSLSLKSGETLCVVGERAGSAPLIRGAAHQLFFVYPLCDGTGVDDHKNQTAQQ